MNILQRIVELAGSGQPFCTGVVLGAEGSTPREAGVRAILHPNGRIEGTLGGGAVEAATQRQAIEACRSQRASILDVELRGEAAGDDMPICGGRMRILVDPTAAKDRAAYGQAATALQERRRGILLTTTRTGAGTYTAVCWVPESDSSALPEAQVARECLADGKARLVSGSTSEPAETVEVLVEPMVPEPLLLIAGGGHVGQALARQALLLGFEVMVFDDRPEFTDPDLFPQGVRTHCGDIATSVAAVPVGEDTYIVIVTRGHQHDAETLKACLHRPAAYIGMMGSRRKVALVRESLIEAGSATEEEWDAVHAPIGLDIGAETVPEIATSIAAQLVAVRRKGRADREPRDMRSR